MQSEGAGWRAITARLTSPIRLPVVEATLTVLVFLECPPILTGDVVDWARACFTTPSAILFLEECPCPLASLESSLLDSGILSRAAAAMESCMSCDSWLESRALLPPPGLMPPSLMGGVKTRSVSLVVLVSCEALLESGGWCC